MNRLFVMGDIHGACRALRQCLERASFDLQRDTLICLGDVADGWPETKQAVNELQKIKRLVYLLGNHDWWTMKWMTQSFDDEIWLSQGGMATVESYRDGIPREHIDFFSKALLYYEIDNRLFVHAGIDPSIPVKEQNEYTFLWDRSLVMVALQHLGNEQQRKLTSYDEVYIGHTPVDNDKPVYSLGVWMMDTGAGWSGRLSMMDVHSREVFTSDPVPNLYPGVEGRKKQKR